MLEVSEGLDSVIEANSTADSALTEVLLVAVTQPLASLPVLVSLAGEHFHFGLALIARRDEVVRCLVGEALPVQAAQPAMQAEVSLLAVLARVAHELLATEAARVAQWSRAARVAQVAVELLAVVAARVDSVDELGLYCLLESRLLVRLQVLPVEVKEAQSRPTARNWPLRAQQLCSPQCPGSGVVP